MIVKLASAFSLGLIVGALALDSFWQAESKGAAEPQALSADDTDARDAGAEEFGPDFIDWGRRPGPYAGVISEDSSGRHYTLTLNDLGVERYEDTKKTTSLLMERWTINCDSREPQLCSLDREHASEFSSDLATIHTNRYWPQDGTLSLDADWPNGRLDLTLLYSAGEKQDIRMRLDYRGNSIYLRELTAVTMFRSLYGGTKLIEVRPLPYDRTVVVPVSVKGWRSASEERWDRLLASLPRADRSVWHRLAADRANRPDPDELPDCLKQSLDPGLVDKPGSTRTEAEQARYESVALECAVSEFQRWLGETRMSGASRDVIAKYVRKAAASGGWRGLFDTAESGG